MKGLQFYKKEKQEKGAITLFVLLACLFFAFILTGVYLSNLNRLQVQEQEVQQIHDNYAKNIDRAEEIYQELAKTATITLRQEPSNGIWTKEVSLIGNAKLNEQNTATIKYYIFNQESTESNQSSWSWQAVTGSNVKELVDVTQSGITKNGTYYFWIKDSEGEAHRSNEVNVQNVDNNKPTAGTLIAKEQNEDGSEENYDLDRSPWTDKNVKIEKVDGTDGEGETETVYTILKNGVEYEDSVTNPRIDPTILTETGTYTITVITTDEAGNTAEREYTIKIDKVVPVLALKHNDEKGEDYEQGTWTKDNLYGEITIDTDTTRKEVEKYQYSENGVIWNDITGEIKQSNIDYTTTFPMSEEKPEWLTGPINNGEYYFEVQADGTLKPNNSGKNKTTAHSYFVIDLTNQPNTSMEITLNVTISSDSDDYGVSIITTSPDAPKYDASITEYFIKESGSVTRTEEYTTTIEGGKKYYLHIGYKKDLRLAYGMDTFLINSLRVKSDNLTENLNFYNYNKNGNVVTFNLNNHLEKNIYIRAVYTDGNTSKYGSKTLINIDKIAPIIGSAKAILISREEGKIETKVFEEGSGVKGYYISTDEEAPTEKSNWIPQTMDEFTIENLKANTTYYLWVIDNVGFISLGRKVQLGIANYLVDDKIGTETLEEAIAVSSNGSEIKLLSDYTDTSTAEFNKNVIFDVQNYTLTKSNQIVISSGKNVEITGTGKITSSYSTGNTIRNDAKLAVKDNVTIEYTGTSTIYAPIDNNTGSSVININDNAHIIGYNTGIRNEYGVVNINGGCIEATNLKSSAKGINNLNAAKIYLNAGEVKGYYGIYITNNSVVDMRGGKVVGIGANGIYGGGTINIYDGRIEGKTYGIYATATDKLTIGREEDTLSTTNPAIYGGSYGVYMNSSYNFNFFNGVLITNTKENIYRGNIKLRTNHTLYTYFDYNIEQKYCTILTPIVEEIKMEANPTEYTNKDVTVKITYPDRNYTMQYSEDSKNWVDASDYIQELVVTENKIIYARIINESGFVEDEKQIEINNIDKENPVIEVSPDETNYVLTSSNGTIDLTIDIKAFDSGVSGLDIVQYAWAKNGEEVKYEDFDSTGKTITQKNLGEGQYNLYFYVTDRAGNEADLQQIRYNVKFGDPVCKIGDITYTTIQAAIDTCSKNAGNTQTTIEMLKNTDEEFEIFAGQNIILDLKGYTIGTSSLDIPLCTNNGQIQIIDSSEEKTGKLESLNGKTIENNGTFTLGDSNTGIEMEVPTIYGYKIGIENNNLFNFYDGKIQGITPIKGNATDMPKDYGTVSTKFENGITTVQLGIVTGYEARIDWVYYTTLIEAIDAANTYKNVSEVTITILKDIQLNETLNISGKNDIVLDLNGYMLTVAPQNDTIIKNYSNLEIMDNSIEQAGNLTITTTSLDYIYAIRNEGEGTLKISSGIIKSCSTKKDGNNYAIYNYSTGTVIMNGGTINSNDSGEDVDSYGIYNYNAGNVIIEGGTINCISSTSNSCGIYNNRKGNLNFLEGNLNVSSADYNDCYGIRNSGIFSMKGGNITAEYSDGFSSSIYGIYNYGSIEITGGNINVIDSGYEYGIYNSSGGTIIFSEGNINADYRGIHNEGEINIEGGTITGRNYGVYNEGRAVIGKENEILEKDNPKIIATNIIRSIQ